MRHAVKAVFVACVVLGLVWGLVYAQSQNKPKVAVYVTGGTTLERSSFTDSRDGKTYRTVRIGKFTWMAQNLNYATGDSWCYEDNESNCQKYGRLYDWNTAMKACPAGWRLPTREDWKNLVENAGGNVAGTKLKARSPDWNGTDDFGFSALPGGYRSTDGSFGYVGSNGYWWRATEYGSGYAWDRRMSSYRERVDEDNYDKGYGNSVLCLQD
jgi:uncharacterized protein (TIGR02145 family)